VEPKILVPFLSIFTEGFGSILTEGFGSTFPKGGYI
jgi:hypothetical protein